MRVGLVLRGGADRSGRERVIPAILWLIERLARQHDLHVFALHHDPVPSVYPLLGATVHDLGRVQTMRGLHHRAQLTRLIQALRAIGGVDLLHAYWALPAGLVATAAARRLRIPSVVTADSGEWVALPDISYGLQRRWWDRRAVRTTMRRATRVTVGTTFMAKLAAAHGIADAVVIPLGVPRPSRETAIAAETGPPWRLLHVGSINRVKDHETLLHALARVVAAESRVHLDVVGEDTRGGRIQRLAADLGLASHVTFHGFQPSDALTAFYARANLLVVSSRHEAAGVVVLEAAAAGVPTVGTDVGYVADWARAGQRAVAVPTGAPNRLGEAIVDLLRDGPERARMGCAARDWATAHDADWTAARFADLYRELAAAR